MPSRFIFSLRFSTKVLLKLGFLCLALVVFMTFFRLNLYFLSVFHATPNAVFVEVAQSFLAGIRFDLSVFAFIFAPIYLVVLIQAISEKWPSGLFQFHKFYFIFVWFLICLITFVDYFHFTRHGARMRMEDYKSWSPEILMQQASALQSNQVWFFLVITVLLFFLGFTLANGIKFGDWKDEYSPKKRGRIEVIWRVLLPLVLIYSFARGTFESEYLTTEQSEVSNFTAINEMALNAVWCFDK